MNLSQYKTQDLTGFRDDYYPIVIAIEAIFPPSYKGRAKKSIQFTYGAFALEADGSFRYKFIKEKLLVSLNCFSLTLNSNIVQQDHI